MRVFLSVCWQGSEGGKEVGGCQKRFENTQFFGCERVLRGSVLVPSVALPDLVPYSFAIKKKSTKTTRLFC